RQDLLGDGADLALGGRGFTLLVQGAHRGPEPAGEQERAHDRNDRADDEAGDQGGDRRDGDHTAGALPWLLGRAGPRGIDRTVGRHTAGGLRVAAHPEGSGLPRTTMSSVPSGRRCVLARAGVAARETTAIRGIGILGAAERTGVPIPGRGLPTGRTGVPVSGRGLPSGGTAD